MSEDETELKDLITDKLSDNGFLFDIKAQIRAAVLHVLSVENSVKFPVDKQKEVLNNYVSKDQGVLALSLVKDLLESLNLKSTLSVFELETKIINFDLKTRDELIQEQEIFTSYNNENDPLLNQYLTRSTNILNPGENQNSEHEIIRGSIKGVTNTSNSKPSKRFLPQVHTSKDADSDSQEDSIEFSDVIGLPGSSPTKENDSNPNPYQVTQRTSYSKSSNDANEYSYEESFHSDKSSDTKQNDKSESIHEVDSEEITEKLDTTSDVTIDTGRDVSFDYAETIK